MTEAEFKAQVRLFAMESLIVQILTGICRSSKNMPSYYLGAREQAIIGTRAMTFPGTDPAMSDHFSAEMELAVVRIWDLVGENLGISA